jgi:uncharacterized protein YehS (DUF1456 family)
MIAIFGLGGLSVSREVYSNWVKKDDDPQFAPCSGEQLKAFLSGLIVDKRGPKEGPPLPDEGPITNNSILRKLKIAMSFKEEDMLRILEVGGMRISRSELSALFRKPDHPHYRQCQDQLLRNFLRGLQLTVQRSR